MTKTPHRDNLFISRARIHEEEEEKEKERTLKNSFCLAVINLKLHLRAQLSSSIAYRLPRPLKVVPMVLWVCRVIPIKPCAPVVIEMC